MTRFSPDLQQELDWLVKLTEMEPAPATLLSTEHQFSEVRKLASYLEAQSAYAYQGLLVFLVILLIAFSVVHRIQAARLRKASAEREAAERSQRLALSVQEEERHRIARELHDETAQSLALARMIADQLDAGDDGSRLRRILTGAMEDIRNVCERMRPPSNWASKPGEMIHSLCASLEERYPLTIHLSLRGDLSVDWDDEVFLHLYRIAQESLVNVIRHAETDEAWVYLEEEDASRITLTIADRGKGINGSEAGLGRRGIVERAELIGAGVYWFEPPEGGTGLSITVRKQQRKTTTERNKKD
jgi:two-component system sensor histidine kinase UhpB